MFESAEIGHKIDKQTYKKEVPALRAALQDAQYDLKENGKIPVVVLVSGLLIVGTNQGMFHQTYELKTMLHAIHSAARHSGMSVRTLRRLALAIGAVLFRRGPEL